MNRERSRLVGIFLCLAVTAATSPATAAEQTLARPVTKNPTVETGRKIYNFRCYFCHGYSGDAKTLAASYLTPSPTDFTAIGRGQLSEARILKALMHGKPETAMKSFKGILSEQEMAAVSQFIINEFTNKKAVNTRYHTAANGWPNHERYRSAFPFATGEIPLDRPWDALTDEQARARHLFVSSCISCHSRNAGQDSKIVWEARPLSYPRNHYAFKVASSVDTQSVDGMTSASPYLLHEIPPKVGKLSPVEHLGKKIFENNCAFCHGADGTGKNWIGSFIEPHPRNLRDPQFMRNMTPTRLKEVIREGLPETSMPAWKSVLSPKEVDALVAYISKAFHPLANQP